MATVAATKTISFKAPYTGATFQSLTGLLMGRDGYISGGITTDDTVVITVQPTTFLQRGVVVQSLAAAAGIPVPTAAEPWFLLASTPDDDPDSGAIFTATADLAVASTSVIVAFKSNGIWTNPDSVNVASAGERDSDSGGEEDLGVADLRALGGTISSISAFKGLLVDPSGKRRVLRTPAANSAKALTQAPVRPNSVFDRNDHIILRQVESFSPDLKAIIGGAIGPNPAVVALESGGGVDRPSHFAKRGGGPGDQWWAWGNGINLKIKGGPAGEAFAASTLLSGTAITSTHLAGQRASDSAVLLLYIDGANLRLVSFTATTGVLVNAAVTLEALTGQISHVRAVLDRNEKLHIVFEHDEGPRQQIYYTKVRVVTGAQFGTAEVSPQIVNGTDSGSNDTWPSIGIDRHGTVTVAHIRGTGANEHGDLVVATIDQNGDTVDQNVIFAAADVGIDPGPTLSPTGYPGVGASFLTFLNVRRTSVVVTPHDEVYVFTVGLDAGVLPNYILAHSPSFKQDHGFELINIAPKLTVAGYGIVAIDAAVGEAGEIYVCHKRESTGAPRTRLIEHTFSTPLLKDGKIPTPIWGGEEFVDLGTVDSFQDLHVSKGPLGEFVVSYMITTTATLAQRAPLSDVVDIIGGVYSRPGLPQRHPKDVYLGTWSVPKALSATLDGHSKRLEVFNTRSKKMNYPILVGQNGDFQGFGSLAQAVAQASRDGGGEIILRPGVHRTLSGLAIGGGISIRGEGSAAIVADSASGIAGFGGSSAVAVTISGNVLTDTTSSADFGGARPGDMIEMSTSGLHVVVRNLGPNPSTGQTRILVENSGAGVPVGATGQLFSSGNRMENLTLLLTVSSTFPLLFAGCYRPILRSIKLEGPTLTGIIMSDCIEPLVDGLDLTKVVNTDANQSFQLYPGRGAILRGIKLADGRGRLLIQSTAQDVHLINCSSDGADASKIIYYFAPGRTTPIYMSGCEGRIDPLGDVAFAISNVGRRLRLPEGGGILELEDDNTRASAITDDGIKLTSATHKQFDGVSIDTITDAANERVKTGGDTMTGTLVGTQIELGATLLATAANARLARLSTPHSGTFDATLIWKSDKDTAGINVRLYVTLSQKIFVTVNASYDGTNWNKDSAGSLASLWIQGRNGFEQWFRDADAAWATWTQISKVSGPRTTSLTPAAPYFDPLLEQFDSGGNRRVGFDHLGYPGSTLTVIRQNWMFPAAGLDPQMDGWDLTETGTADINYSNGVPQDWRGIYLATIGSGAQAAKAKTRHPFIQFDQTGSGEFPHPTIVGVMEWEAVSWVANAANIGATLQMGFDSDNYGGNDSTVNFRKEEGNANWKFVLQNDAGARTDIDTGVAFTQSVPQRFRIEVYGASTPGGRRYLGFIDGVLVAEHTSAAANRPDRDLGIVFDLTWVSGAPNKIFSISPVCCTINQRLTDYAL